MFEAEAQAVTRAESERVGEVQGKLRALGNAIAELAERWDDIEARLAPVLSSPQEVGSKTHSKVFAEETPKKETPLGQEIQTLVREVRLLVRGMEDTSTRLGL